MKLEVLITGKKVHDVGYRRFLLTQALTAGIDIFFTSNSYIKDKQAVILRVEGEESAVMSLLDFVKTNFPKDAEEIEDIKHHTYEGRIMNINQYMLLAQVEQLDKLDNIIEKKED